MVEMQQDKVRHGRHRSSSRQQGEIFSGRAKRSRGHVLLVSREGATRRWSPCTVDERFVLILAQLDASVEKLCTRHIFGDAAHWAHEI